MSKKKQFLSMAAGQDLRGLISYMIATGSGNIQERVDEVLGDIDIGTVDGKVRPVLVTLRKSMRAALDTKTGDVDQEKAHTAEVAATEALKEALKGVVKDEQLPTLASNLAVLQAHAALEIRDEREPGRVPPRT